MGEELFLYLAVTLHAVSSTLIREEGKVQKPVYYTSRALRGVEGRYPLIEKLAFALITASRKLMHYFQAHVINVIRPPAQESHEQAGSRRTIDPVGSRT